MVLVSITCGNTARQWLYTILYIFRFTKKLLLSLCIHSTCNARFYGLIRLNGY